MQIEILGNTIRWASFTGVSVGDVPFQDNRWNYTLGDTGTDFLTIKDNLITETATGAYTISMHTWQNADHLYIGHNRFIDIDTENLCVQQAIAHYFSSSGHRSVVLTL